jgi:uncharacterized membrane protein
MTVAAGIPPELESYLAAVREALADLPPAERDDLLTEVEVSLAEAASEGEGPIAARLGPPQDFAAELRAAAGLHEGARPSSRSEPRLMNQLGELAARVAHEPRVIAIRGLLTELAPIWWVARAYFAVGAVALASGASWSQTFGAVPRIDSGTIGLVVIVLAMVVSVAFGLLAGKKSRPTGRIALTVNAALLIAAVPVAFHVIRDLRQGPPVSVALVTVPEALPGLAYNGTPLFNIYPYDRNGRRLSDVRLYDSAGAPIDVRSVVPDPQRRLLRTVNGKVIFNAFPIRYYEPGTKRVANPNAGPPIRSLRVATPALGKRSGSKKR